MQFLRACASEIVDFVEKQPVWSLIYFSVFYLGSTLAMSRAKMFWYDELATYYVSRLPDWPTIFAALKGGADLNPPPLYFFTRLSHMLFGDGEVATRLPETLGFLLMLLCLFRVVALRTSSSIAFATICFPMVTGAYYYAAEARPYGMTLGLTGAAILFWQRTGMGSGRNLLSIAGMTVCLTAAVMTHAYAVLAIGPFLLAELVRWYVRKEFRLGVWIGLLLPFAGLAGYLPLLSAHYSAKLDNPLFTPNLMSLANFYHMMLDPGFYPLLLVLIAAIVSRKPEGAETVEKRGFPGEEIALAIGFLLVPLAAFTVAIFVTHIFFDRYALPAIFGLVIVLGALLARSSSPRLAGYATMVLGFWWVISATAIPAVANRGPGAVQRQEMKLEELYPEQPIVVSFGLSFGRIAHYADSKLAERLVYLVDRDAAVEVTGSDAFEVAYPIQKKWYGMKGNVVPYKEFLARQKPFLVFGPTMHSMDWLVKKLIADGATVKLIGILPDALICQVIPPAPKP